MNPELKKYKNKYFQLSFPKDWHSQQDVQFSQDRSCLTLRPASPESVRMDFMLLGKPQQDWPLAELRILSSNFERADTSIPTTKQESVPAFQAHYTQLPPNGDRMFLLEVTFIQTVYKNKAWEFRYTTVGPGIHQKYLEAFASVVNTLCFK